MGELIVLPVVVTTPPAPVEGALDSVAPTIDALLDAIARELALPIRCEVRHEIDDQGPWRHPPWRLRIGDTIARLCAAPAPSDELPMRLIGDLSANRELLVTAAVADVLASRAPESAFAALSPEERLAAARECVALCMRPDRLLTAAATPWPDEPAWWSLIEDALDQAPALAFGTPAASTAAGPDVDALARAAFEETGVLVPPVTFAADVAEGCLRVRDLTLPVPVRGAERPFATTLLEAPRDRLAPFVTRSTLLARLLDLARERPRLVAAVRARFSPVFLARTARALVRDGIRVRDLRSIAEAMLELRGATTADEVTRIVLHAPAGIPTTSLAMADGRFDPEDAADGVRRWSQREISLRHWQDGELMVQLLDHGLEMQLREQSLAPGAPAHEALIALLADGRAPLLTTVDVRRRLADAIAVERPDLPVLSYQELLPETSITVERRLVPASAAADAP